MTGWKVSSRHVDPVKVLEAWKIQVAQEKRFHPFSSLINQPKLERIPQSTYSSAFSSSKPELFLSRKISANAVPSAGRSSYCFAYDEPSAENMAYISTTAPWKHNMA